MKIPLMGFSEHFIQNVSEIPESTRKLETKPDRVEGNSYNSSSAKLSDQEILESTEGIYFEENVNTDVYVLNVSMVKKSWYHQSLMCVLIGFNYQFI